MTMPQTPFDRRVADLEKKHQRLADGASYRIGPEGLIVAEPRRRFAPRFPVKGLLLLVASAFAFKAILFVASGEAPYAARLAELEKGRPVERAMAWVMRPDPVTRAIAATVDMATRAAEAELQ